MKRKFKRNKRSETAETDGRTAKRSSVPELTNYRDYLPYLRRDFYYSCAYCTTTECEAIGHRFEVDHYEPASRDDPDKNRYTNLMYSCNECNYQKLDLDPPPEAKVDGFRLVKADVEPYDDQFEIEGTELKGKTRVGDCSVDVLELNRAFLVRIRGIRRELHECEEFIRSGVYGLLNFSIDRLPPRFRANALAIKKAIPKVREEFEESIDNALRAFAHSELIDPDGDLKEFLDRRKKNKIIELRGLYFGSWRGRDKQKAPGTRKTKRIK